MATGSQIPARLKRRKRWLQYSCPADKAPLRLAVPSDCAITSSTIFGASR